MEGKKRNDIKAKMIEAEIPVQIFESMLPAEKKEGAKKWVTT